MYSVTEIRDWNVSLGKTYPSAVTILDHLMTPVFLNEMPLQRVTAYKVETIFQQIPSIFHLALVPGSALLLLKSDRLCSLFCLSQSRIKEVSIHAAFDFKTSLPSPLPPHLAPRMPWEQGWLLLLPASIPNSQHPAQCYIHLALSYL